MRHGNVPPVEHKPMKEAQIQRTVAEALDRAGVVWFHPPNENKLLSTADNPGHLMGMMKREGLKPGVPDCLILTAPPKAEDHFCGVALEIKAGSNTPTDHQEEWLDKLSAEGWLVEWQQGLDPCLDFLRDCGYII